LNVIENILPPIAKPHFSLLIAVFKNTLHYNAVLQVSHYAALIDSCIYIITLRPYQLPDTASILIRTLTKYVTLYKENISNSNKGKSNIDKFDETIWSSRLFHLVILIERQFSSVLIVHQTFLDIDKS
jgi:hypothetical protein